MAKKETATSTKLPSHDVFVVEQEGDKRHWTKIGAGWPHKDDSGFNVQLVSLPVDGRLVLRACKAKEDKE